VIKHYRCYKTLLIRFKEKEYIENLLKELKDYDSQDYMRCVADANMTFQDYKTYEDGIKYSEEIGIPKSSLPYSNICINFMR
jgi:hypothetical protein